MCIRDSFGGISPWYEKYCSEECPGLTMNAALPHGLTLDPTGPAFPFGYGLDYLEVTLQNATVALPSRQTHFALDDVRLTVTVELVNAADMGGGYVVQCYFSPPVSPSRLTRYRQMLAGFKKIELASNANATISVPILARDLAHWDPASPPSPNPKPKAGSHIVDSGEYKIWVCHDARGLDSAQASTEGLPAPRGKCLSLSVTL
eukprot:TRINITY_DN7790_c0_g1_i1.p1 TRINITY_DN7790_c0_g1~~TRINITY_DN7790_c0_g1_i1.p1  ORF type:complete len:204 (+),score=35.13 TRINITY_DN7790_c0_g1_i1:128-739(+)